VSEYLIYFSALINNLQLVWLNGSCISFKLSSKNKNW